MRLTDAATVLSEYGPRWACWRLLYDMSLRTGGLRLLFPPHVRIGDRLSRTLRVPQLRLPDHLADLWSEQRGALFLSAPISGYGSSIAAPDSAVAQANEILAGRIPFFCRSFNHVGNPPDWHLSVMPGTRWPSDQHWSSISDLSRQWGDIKHVWEPARFTLVYSLARAYALTMDERYPEAFWSHVESWIQSNPPEIGPHWRCGQELALRSIAWIFGLHAFQSSPASTPTRIASLVEQLWYHASHIEKSHWYASKCVRNNHALSEAVALFTIGTVFPFLREARRWQQKGIGFLTAEAAWQIYDDGTYIQHSTNYARLVLQLFTWTIAVASANRLALPDTLIDRARRLFRFLLALQDETSGRLPNYGSNDGALLFPLSSCGSLDYRPALNALSVVLDNKTIYPPGPWDEEAAWFAGPQRVARAERIGPSGAAGSQSFPLGGYYTLRAAKTHALIRCGSYHHRPAQADMLHLDVWYQGQNVLIDPGTFSYNSEPPWADYFVGTASHNTVTVDGRDQMKRGARFMWLHWTKATVLRFETRAKTVVFEGEQYGYSPIVHRRKVILREGLYLILDDLLGGEAEHTFRLHWLVNDFPLEARDDGAALQPPGEDADRLRLVMLSSSGGQCTHARADEATPRGWQSLSYGERQPAWSFDLVVQGRGARFATLLGPENRITELLPLTMTDVTDLAVAWEADEGRVPSISERFALRS